MTIPTGAFTVRTLWHRIILALGLVGLGAGPAAKAAPAPVYENTGFVNSPMVDALTFLNRGTFQVFATDLPYETQNTLHYTNFSGATMGGSGGYRFDFMATNGFRRPASSFFNAGSVSGTSWLLIDATNIVNRAGMTVGPAGLMSIKGDEVQLSRSGLRAGEDPNDPISPGFIQDPNYSNDAGVTDVYAGVGVNNALDPATPGPYNLNQLAGTPARSGSHEVLLPSGFTNRVNLSAPNAFAITNALGPTNWLVQVTIVDTNSFDPLFKTAVRWAPPRIGDVDGGMMAMVQYTFEDVDTITGEPFTNYVYVLDNLGALTNAVFFTNQANPTLLRPSSFEVTRITPPEWDAGITTNAVYTPELIVNPNYVTDQVTNVYAAYAATIGVSQRGSSGGFPGFGGGSFGQIPELSHPTNVGGRIEIDAGKLDLNLTRFRSEGLLSVKADQITPKAPMKVDSPLVRFDVGSYDGPLLVSNLVELTVRRFSGQVSCYSTVWTNQTLTTGPDPNDPAATITNTIDIRFHALIVQHNFQTIIPVETLSFNGRANEAQIWDDLTIQEEFAIDAPSVELHSGINLGSVPVTADTFPSIEKLVVEGSLGTSVGMMLGSAERPVPLISNSGTLSSLTMEVQAEALENMGTLRTSLGDIALLTPDLKFEGGEVSAAANLRVEADDFKAQMSTIQVGGGGFGSLVLDVRNRLTDGNGDALGTNQWLVLDGIQLLRKPAEGDLLHTEVYSFLNRFRQGLHVWAGEDRGGTRAGFENNAALGKLTLDGTPFTLFSFAGPDPTNSYALYVDYLDLTNSAVDVDLTMEIAPNFTLYFADSSVPADQLNGALDGRLQWVQDQAGALSGVPVTLGSGETVRVNRALLSSSLIDSDGDGVANASDAEPFTAAGSVVTPLQVSVRLLAGAASQAEIVWRGRPGAQYRVEYTRRLAGGEWQTLLSCEQKEPLPATLRACDTVTSPGEQRFYRVVEVR